MVPLFVVYTVDMVHEYYFLTASKLAQFTRVAPYFFVNGLSVAFQIASAGSRVETNGTREALLTFMDDLSVVVDIFLCWTCRCTRCMRR